MNDMFGPFLAHLLGGAQTLGDWGGEDGEEQSGQGNNRSVLPTDLVLSSSETLSLLP